MSKISMKTDLAHLGVSGFTICRQVTTADSTLRPNASPSRRNSATYNNTTPPHHPHTVIIKLVLIFILLLIMIFNVIKVVFS